MKKLVLLLAALFFVGFISYGQQAMQQGSPFMQYIKKPSNYFPHTKEDIIAYYEVNVPELHCLALRIQESCEFYKALDYIPNATISDELAFELLTKSYEADLVWEKFDVEMWQKNGKLFSWIYRESFSTLLGPKYHVHGSEPVLMLNLGRALGLQLERPIIFPIIARRCANPMVLKISTDEEQPVQPENIRKDEIIEDKKEEKVEQRFEETKKQVLNLTYAPKGKRIHFQDPKIVKTKLERGKEPCPCRPCPCRPVKPKPKPVRKKCCGG